MRSLFVYPNIVGVEGISQGIASLSAYLKKEGHETDLMDFTWGATIGDCVSKVKESNPDVIGFSLNSGVFTFCLAAARELKNNFDIPIIFGGIHPTVAPEECIEPECVDMICIGEGELALAELLSKMEKGSKVEDTKNFWIKEKGQIIKNPLRPLIKNLDSLPIIDRELFDYERYCQNTAGYADLMISRGCPFTCTYCVNPVINKLYHGSYRRLRYKSVDRILDEISDLIRNYSVASLRFNDDIFPPNIAWLREFAEKYPKRFDMPFSCCTRIELVTQEMCTMLKNANCVYLNLGIESGSEKIRREVMNRQMTNEQIIRAFRIAKEADLPVGSFNMVGLPYETTTEIRETIALNREVNPDFLQVSIFAPYPGTELRELCKQKGWIRDYRIPSTHRSKPVTRYPYISTWQIEWWWRTFRFRVLLGRNTKKAFLMLLFDMCYDIFVWTRQRMPKFLKKVAYTAEQWAKQG